MIYYKLYDYIDVPLQSKIITPKGINYKTGLNRRLYPKHTFHKGTLIETEYFENFDGTNYSDSVIKVEMDYYYGADTYVSKRKVRRSWMLTNGLYSEDYKITEKFYDRRSANLEGIRRRDNLINNLISKFSEMLQLMNPSLTAQESEAPGVKIIEKYKTEIDNFIGVGNDTALKNRIINEDDPEFLYFFNLNLSIYYSPNINVKDYILDELTWTPPRIIGF